MNHKELHKALSEDFNNLREGILSPQQAREIFNGAGKILSNCKNELIAISMGFKVDVPLLEIKKSECIKTFNPSKPIEENLNKIQKKLSK